MTLNLAKKAGKLGYTELENSLDGESLKWRCLMFGLNIPWRRILGYAVPAILGIVLLLSVLHLIGARSAADAVTHGLWRIAMTLLGAAIFAVLFLGWWWWYRRTQRHRLGRAVGWREALLIFYNGNMKVSGPGKAYWTVILVVTLVFIALMMVVAQGHVLYLVIGSAVYIVLLVGGLDSMAKADYGLTVVYEATARIVEREKRFRWILWAYRNRTHITSDAAARLNGLMFLLSLGLPQARGGRRSTENIRSILWLSVRLKRAISNDALVDTWLTDPAEDGLNIDTARTLAESFVAWARGRQAGEVQEILNALEMVEGWTERFDQHDLVTLDELQLETTLTPDLRLPAHLIRWAIEDCPTFEKPRAKLLGGVQVVGLPGFDVIRPVRELGQWTSDAAGKPTCKERKLRPEMPLGQIRLQITIPKAETMSGPAVASDFVVFGRLRNIYKAVYEIDDWEFAVVQVLLDFMRSLFRKLSFEAAYGHKDLISTAVSRCAKGEAWTIEMGKGEKPSLKRAKPSTILSLWMLRRFGFIITDMAVIDINAASDADQELLRIEYVADKKGKAEVIKAEAEGRAIRQRGEAYAAQGDLAAAMIQQDTLTHLPPTSTVIVGGGDSQQSVLTAELIGRKLKGEGGKSGDKDKGGKPEDSKEPAKPPASK